MSDEKAVNKAAFWAEFGPILLGLLMLILAGAGGLWMNIVAADQSEMRQTQGTIQAEQAELKSRLNVIDNELGHIKNQNDETKKTIEETQKAVYEVLRKLDKIERGQ